MVHLTAGVYISKEGSELQHKIWKPSELKVRMIQWVMNRRLKFVIEEEFYQIIKTYGHDTMNFFYMGNMMHQHLK